jgi:hypothetical protein
MLQYPQNNRGCAKMEYIKTGFAQTDEKTGGLKRGEVYFICAPDWETARGFAASLCASVNSCGAGNAVFYTDSPIPYCRCEHIHFTNVEELIEFLRVSLANQKIYDLPKTDISIFEYFDLLSMAYFEKWPANKQLQRHLYESNLYAIKNLAEEFQAAVLLTDKSYESADNPDDLKCGFTDIRQRLAEATFYLSEHKNDILGVQYINHRSASRVSFALKSTPKEIMQVYPAFSEQTKL